MMMMMMSIQAGIVDNGPENVFRHHLHQFCNTNGKYYISHYFSQKYAKFAIPAV